MRAAAITLFTENMRFGREVRSMTRHLQHWWAYLPAKTGIGQWSDAEFVRAHAPWRGTRRAQSLPGLPLYLLCPHEHRDAPALKGYLFGLLPVRSAPPASELSFPFNQRYLCVAGTCFSCRQMAPAGPAALRRVEPRCLSREGARPLRRVPHSAEPSVRARWQQEVGRRRDGRQESLQHFLGQRGRHRCVVRHADRGLSVQGTC
jgi:hypothetical protein